MVIVVRVKDVRIYVAKNGRKPFVDWMRALKDKSIRYQIERRITRIELGNYGDVKSIGGGIKELRLSFGSGYRIYFGEFEDQVVLLLCGGDKSSQRKDILKARQFWQDYLSR